MYLVDNACQKKGVDLACFQASHKAPISHSMKSCAFRYTENDNLIILVQPYSLSNVSMSPQTLKHGRIIPPQETGPHIADIVSSCGSHYILSSLETAGEDLVFRI